MKYIFKFFITSPTRPQRDKKLHLRGKQGVINKQPVGKKLFHEGGLKGSGQTKLTKSQIIKIIRNKRKKIIYRNYIISQFTLFDQAIEYNMQLYTRVDRKSSYD